MCTFCLELKEGSHNGKADPLTSHLHGSPPVVLVNHLYDTSLGPVWLCLVQTELSFALTQLAAALTRLVPVVSLRVAANLPFQRF